MPGYKPCEGTGRKPVSVKQLRTAHLGSKFSHLHGKVLGKCPACGASKGLSAQGNMAAHKDARNEGVDQ